ncbi:MAG TPA: pyridoxal-dependent decarboxylase [Acidobacteriaceae bacterium]|jgi:glutamate/tyrosine decarboxylase-like PLP-dependent enzyme|nr:pyridoxal-dependent decarboxylase [Acidobacteriaceae bacterium]
MLIDGLRDEFHSAEAAIDGGPIYPEVTAAEIRDHLAGYDFRRGLPLEQVAADVEQMLRRWQVHVTHPRYFGLFNPSVTLASVVADILTATYNPQLAAWRTSPAAIEIERHTLAWLAGKFGLPTQTAASFTSGGAEANLSALIAALTQVFPEYGEQGLHRLPHPPVFYISAEAHHSFSKIAHMSGLGRDAVRTVRTGRDLKMDPADLAAQVAEDRRAGLAPFLVVGTAGTTAAGVIDPLPELARFCHDQRLWFHADAAWGGAAILSPSLGRHLAGIESADSITCDAHKWFSVAMGCGMFFCRHPETVERAFRAEASYMPGKAGADTSDPYTHSLQWSRRFTGLKLFLALAERGEEGQAQAIDHQARLGNRMRERLAASHWTIVNNTPLPVVCFTREGLNLPSFLKSLQTQQIAWMSEARLGTSSVVRACMTSFKTTEKDIDQVVERITRLAADQKNGQLAAATP